MFKKKKKVIDFEYIFYFIYVNWDKSTLADLELIHF